VLTDGGKGDGSTSLMEREEGGNEGGEAVRFKGRVGERRGEEGMQRDRVHVSC